MLRKSCRSKNVGDLPPHGTYVVSHLVSKQCQPPTVSIPRSRIKSSMRLNNLPGLKRLPTLQRLPSPHTPNLHTNHILIPVLWRKVAHRRRLLPPRIPHNRIWQVVAHDVEAGLRVFRDGGGVLSDLLVDAVDFGGYGEGGGGFGRGFGVEDAVDVGGAQEAG